jgi:hypothetical protein
MDPGPTRRRKSDHGYISVGELGRRLDRHEDDSDEIHRDLVQLVRRLDERTDHLSTRITVVFSVVAVLWAIFLVIAPVLRGMLNLPSG